MQNNKLPQNSITKKNKNDNPQNLHLPQLTPRITTDITINHTLYIFLTLRGPHWSASGGSLRGSRERKRKDARLHTVQNDMNFHIQYSGEMHCNPLTTTHPPHFNFYIAVVLFFYVFNMYKCTSAGLSKACNPRICCMVTG